MKKANTESTLAPSQHGYSYDDLIPLVHSTLKAGISALVRGHPGVGKSSLAQETASRMGLPIHDIRLAQREPSEIGGIYFPDRKNQRLELMAPQWVKQVCDQPGFVFLDEINAAVTRLHQAAAYQIVLEHRVGPFLFHPETVVMAAGNLAEDNALVSQLSSALCNRFAHFTLRVDAKDWLSWAAANDVDDQIMAYIGRHREPALYDNDGGFAFPSPRSWAMASRIIQDIEPKYRRRALSACVGVTASEKFENYLKIYRRINAQAIIEKGKSYDFSKGKTAEPSFIYAALFSVAAWLKARVQESKPLEHVALQNIVKFLRSPGLDPEYVFLFLKQIKQLPSLVGELKVFPEYRELASDLVDVRVKLYR